MLVFSASQWRSNLSTMHLMRHIITRIQNTKNSWLQSLTKNTALQLMLSPSTHSKPQYGRTCPFNPTAFNFGAIKVFSLVDDEVVGVHVLEENMLKNMPRIKIMHSLQHRIIQNQLRHISKITLTPLNNTCIQFLHHFKDVNES